MLTEQEKAEGWISLFDGGTLEGWDMTGKPEGWTVDDGAILCTVQGGAYLHTLERFGDFILKTEFKIDPGVNSGIFVRWGDLADPVQTGIEVQVLDTHGKEPATTHDCGAIYDLVPPTRNVCKPAGEWNDTVVTCNGSLISVEMNGEQIAEMDVDEWTTPQQNLDGTPNKFTTALKDFPREGHIGLQDHGGKVWYRNIELKKLS